MTRRVTKGVIELEWVCPNCDSRNRGSKKACENCGAPQPENVKFQRPSEEKIITDEKVVAAAKSGADIHCGFCGTRNPVTATTCSQCGGDLKEGMARQAGQVLQAAPVQPKTILCKNCGTENPSSERTCSKCGSPLPRAEIPQPAAPVQAVAAPSSVDPSAMATKRRPNWLLWGGIGAALLICCAALVMLFAVPSRSVQGTVTDVQWQTSVPVQEMQSVNYSNESGSPPSDAYNVSCHTESREVCEEKVVDTGTGYGEVVEECHDVSEQYCDYTVDEWKTLQSYDLSGNDLFPVYADPQVLTDQRVGDASKDFTVQFSTPDGSETYSPDSISEFQQFQVGSTWTLKLNAMGGVLDVVP